MKAHWTSRLGDIATRQLAIASAQSANTLASMAADDLRADAKAALNVRSATFLRYFIKGPSKRATKAVPVARVFVGAPPSAKDKDRGNLLIQHDEEGTNTKRPFSSPALMVPTKAYRAASRGAPRKWKEFKRDMGMGTKRGIASGGLLGMGRRFETYLVKSKRTGRTLLWLRTGVGRFASELLYVSKPMVKIPRRTRTRQTVTERLEKSAAQVMGRELTKAIASAREVTNGGGRTSSRLPQ